MQQPPEVRTEPNDDYDYRDGEDLANETAVVGLGRD